MKTEELTALGLTEDQAKQVLAMNGRDIERHKGDITTLTARLEETRHRLTAANAKLEGYDPEWKTKADKLTESVKAEWADFITTEKTEGARVETPPTEPGGAPDYDRMTDAEYYKTVMQKG